MAEERKKRTIISGPGAADFLAAPGGLDTPESGTKGVAYTREEPLVNTDEIVPDVAEVFEKPGRRPSKL